MVVNITVLKFLEECSRLNVTKLSHVSSEMFEMFLAVVNPFQLESSLILNDVLDGYPFLSLVEFPREIILNEGRVFILELAGEVVKRVLVGTPIKRLLRIGGFSIVLLVIVIGAIKMKEDAMIDIKYLERRKLAHY